MGLSLGLAPHAVGHKHRANGPQSVSCVLRPFSNVDLESGAYPFFNVDLYEVAERSAGSVTRIVRQRGTESLGIHCCVYPFVRGGTVMPLPRSREVCLLEPKSHCRSSKLFAKPEVHKRKCSTNFNESWNYQESLQ